MSIFGDTSWVNEENAVNVLPPTVQWHRGDLTNVNASLKNGCWQFPAELFSGLAPVDWTPVDVIHSGGEVVPSFLQDKISLAIIAYRKRWFYKADGKKIYLPPKFENDGKKISSNLQIWAICKELINQAVIISVSGTTSMAVEEAMNSFVRQVVTGAARLAKTRFARYHFWMPLITSPKQATKESTYITPPRLALETINEDVLRSLFTGKVVAELAEAELAAAQDWATLKMEPAAPEFVSELNGVDAEIEF